MCFKFNIKLLHSGAKRFTMAEKIKIGVLRETKNPPDRRVAITPANAVDIMSKYPNVEIVVQPSPIRCYSDDEYRYLDIPLKEDLSDCDLLVGVKEVDISALIPNKTYLFFAHVAKEQPYNQKLLKAIVEKNIKLVDYEYLTDNTGQRLVAFGRWAGIVGAYNGLRARGLRTDYFQLKPAHECHDMDEMFAGLKKIKLKPIKIVLTGGGRVANGALETLRQLNLKEVSPKDFLTKTYDEAVLCQLQPWDYVERTDGEEFELNHFFNHPKEYRSIFKPYTKVSDMFVACHYWDPESPVFFTKDDMKCDDWKISIIADVSCDIDGPIPSTVKASTIANPFYGYNRFEEKDVQAFIDPKNVTVMAVDNLPGELPRNASQDFGETLIEKVFDSFICDDCDGVIRRATITERGSLAKKYSYLQAYLEGKK